MSIETHQLDEREAGRHPDVVALIEFARGEAVHRDRRRLHRHCLVCDDCALQLRALLALRDGHGLGVASAARAATRGLAATAGRVRH